MLPGIASTVAVMTSTTPSPDRLPSLVSVRLITDDVARLATFYELVTGTPVRWATPDFAELVTAAGTLAIGSTRTVALFGAGSARAAANSSAIVEFLVDDVDALHAQLRDRLSDTGGTFVNEPTTMPWGNRSLLLRDPDHTLVNCFTPVTADAIARFGR